MSANQNKMSIAALQKELEKSLQAEIEEDSRASIQRIKNELDKTNSAGKPVNMSVIKRYMKLLNLITLYNRLLRSIDENDAARLEDRLGVRANISRVYTDMLKMRVDGKKTPKGLKYIELFDNIVEALKKFDQHMRECIERIDREEYVFRSRLNDVKGDLRVLNGLFKELKEFSNKPVP
jgi:hypothetical protein